MKKLIGLLVVAFSWCGMAISATTDVTTTPSNGFILPQFSKQVSLDFKDANLKDVLKVFSRQINSNFVIESSIEDVKVTVYLENVPVEEALSSILTANNLAYSYNESTNIFFVTKNAVASKLITRVYPLKFATVPSSKIRSTLSITGVKDQAAGTGLITALQSSLSKDGKLSEDPRTNSLVITDNEGQFVQIEKILAKLDVPVTQVLIQVEMIDVSKGVIDAIGVKFGQQFFNLSGGSSVDYKFPFNPYKLNAQTVMSDSYGNGTFSTTMGAAIEALRTNSDTKYLARPRILTLDNETAQIKIITDEIIDKSSTTDSNGVVTNTYTRYKTGVELTVTPQVNLLNNQITMALTPKVIESASSVEFSPGKDPEERSANLMMKVNAGETIIVGGLLRKKDKAVITKVPLLGSIPLIGNLFKHKSTDTQNRELMIFITPYILDNNGNALDANKKVIDINKRERSMIDREKLINDDLTTVSNSYQR